MPKLHQNIVCLTAIGAPFLPVYFASAQAITSPISFTTFPALLGSLATMLGDLFVGLGSLMVIIAGIIFLVSAGNPGMIQKGKTALLYAILGIIIGISVNAITSIIGGIPGAGNNVSAIFTSIAQDAGELIAGLSTIMVIVSGIFFLFSFGDAGRIETAKKTLLYAVIGIIIGLSATIIVAFIRGLAP